MADINTLNIQISASTAKADKAIDSLISSLGKLNMALNNYSDQSGYVKGLKNLTNGLTGVADAVASIDVNKIQEVSKAVGSLASAGGKLSKMTFAKSFSDMGKSLNATEAKIKEAAESIAKTFGISSKEGISDLTAAIREFYSASDPSSLKSAEDYVKGVIKDYTELNSVLSSTQELYNSVRRYLSGSNITLPRGWTSEFSKSERGKLGIGNTSADATQSMNVASAIEEMNGVLGTTFDTSKNEMIILHDVVDYLYRLEDAIKEEAEANRDFAVSTTEVSQALDTLYEKFGKVREVQSADDNAFLGAGGVDFSDMELPFGDGGFGEVETSARSADAAVKEVVSDVQEVKTELNDITVQNPFDGVINGIEALNGVSLDAEQFSGVKLLAESMGKLGGSNTAAAADALPKLASAIQSFSSVSVPSLEGVSQLAADLRSLGSKTVVAAAQSLPQIITSLERLSTLTIPSPAGLMDVANSIKAFGSAAAVKATANIPSLAASLGALMSTLAAAPVVNQSVIDLVNALAQLSANGSTATNIINRLTGSTTRFGSSARKASKHTKGLASTIGSIYAKFFLLIRAFRLIKGAIGYASDLTEVQNVVATTFGDSTAKVQEFADTAIMSFGMSELSAKQFASRFQSMGSAMGVSTEQVKKASDYLVGVIPQTERVERLYGNLGDSMADVSINLTKLTADMASFYNVDYADVAEDMQAVFTGMTRPLRKYGLDLTQATLKEWALANGMNADISKMTQAEKTMLRYQYVMSRMGHVMGDFDKTMNTWANVIRTIGQQFQKLGQIIGKGFISALKPILIQFRDFLNTFIDLAEKALNALGKLLGWQFEIEDVGTTLDDDMEDYADGIDDAGESAKKLKKMLLGIDELNLLPDNSDDDAGGGGGGGGGGLSGGATGGELHLVPYDSDIDSWFEFGRAIADKIKEWLQSIDWEGYFKKAEEAGKNFAEFLNGLFDPEMFYEIGKAIANGLNTILHFLHSFALEFDGTNFGLAIAAQINGFFENFDFKLLAATLNEWADKLWDAIKAAIYGDENGEGGINWDAIKTGLSDFFSTIELDTVALIIGAITIKKVLKWVFSGGILKSLGTALTKAITAGGGLTGVAEAIGKKIGGSRLVTGFSAAIAGAGGLKNFLFLDMAALVGEGAVSVGTMIGSSIIGGIGAAFLGWNFGQLLYEVITGEEIDMSFFEQMKEIKESFTDGSWRGALELWGADIAEGFRAAGSAIADFFAPAIEGISATFTSLGENVHIAVTGIRVGFSELGAYLVGVWNGITTNLSNWWNTKILPLFTKEKWSEIGAHLKEGFETKWSEFKTWYDGTALAQWWSDVKAKFTKENWQETGKNIKEGFSVGWANFKNWWNNTAFAEFWRDIKERKFSKDSWNLSGIWEGLQAAIERGIQAIRSAWENFKNSFSFNLNLPDIGGYIDDIKKKWGELDLGGGSGKKFASGGFPATGSLFIANEAGPEMVGTIGNRTAVVNNGQIVESIKAGVYEAMASAMAASGGNNVSVVLEGDTASFFSAIVRENNREIMRTGKSRLRN